MSRVFLNGAFMGVALFMMQLNLLPCCADELQDSPANSKLNIPPSGENSGEAEISNPLIRDTSVPFPPMTGKEKFRHYLKSTYGPKSLLSSMAASGIRQARDTVPEWGQGMEGYGKRLGSSMARKAVKHTIQFSIGIMLHEDPRYFRCNCPGVLPRALYASGRAFVSQKDSGGIRPAYSRFAGTIGAAFVSRQWYPESRRTASDYATSMAVSVGLDMAKNVFVEFWPDIKRRLHR